MRRRGRDRAARQGGEVVETGRRGGRQIDRQTDTDRHTPVNGLGGYVERRGEGSILFPAGQTTQGLQAVLVG